MARRVDRTTSASLATVDDEPKNDAKARADRLKAAAAANAVSRTWRSADGKHTIEASFAGFGNGKLRLRKTEGKVIEVPLEKLCPEDQAFVRAKLK